jgi:2,3-bisphosphoglycerate-independent phosphoglycerate mutase
MGELYIRQIENVIRGSHIHLASVIGRYYAMDRDNRWERTRLAYDLLVNGAGSPTSDFAASVKAQYAKGVTDEFMVALKSRYFDEKNMNIREGDVAIFFNFRTDRPRQLTQVLTQSDMHEYNMHALQLHLVTFTDYDKTFRNVHVLFEKDNLDNTLGQILSENGKTQVRIAETEKYPHVTFFFNGGREQPYPGESRIMIPSPKVATYDLKPEMSAYEITEAILQFVKNNPPDFICLNYANTDMVGHTGDFKAAVKAAETVDACLGKLIPVLQENEYCIFIIADHGNSDVMVNEDGSPNTAHTTNPVPVIVVSDPPFRKVNSGKLGDIAPTILSVMDVPAPAVMKGNILIN